jgi:hypothetical protein
LKENLNLSKVVDEYANNKVVDIENILEKAFL